MSSRDGNVINGKSVLLVWPFVKGSTIKTILWLYRAFGVVAN
jgi:hypothetical protein